MAGYRGGPYVFRDSLVMGRLTSQAAQVGQVFVKSNFYPVSITTEEDDTIVATATAEGDTEVDFGVAGTYTVLLSDAGATDGPKSGTDSFSVTIA